MLTQSMMAREHERAAGVRAMVLKEDWIARRTAGAVGGEACSNMGLSSGGIWGVRWSARGRGRDVRCPVVMTRLGGRVPNPVLSCERDGMRTETR